MAVLDDARKLQAWLDRCKGNRGTVENTWQQIADNLFGMRDFTTQRTPGEDRMWRIYDTTALTSLQLLAGALHGMLTNPVGVWFDLEPDDPRLLGDIDVSRWLETCRNTCLSVMNASRSGFVTNLAEVYLDVPGFGTGGLWVERHPEIGVTYSCRPLRELYLEDNDEGKIDVVFREVQMTARQVAIRFRNKTPTRVARELEGGNPETMYTLCQVVTRSDDPYAGTSRFRKEWASVIWSGIDGRPEILERSGYDEMPLLTPRWSVESGEIYGRGSGHQALPDGKMLNAMQKTILKAAQKAADPPLLVSDEGVLSGIRTMPGGINYVQDRPGIGGQPDAIRPLLNNARVDIGIDLIDRKIQAVRNAFWSQTLQMFEDPRMTATQVLALASQAQRMMAPITGRLAQELLEPLVNRTFAILLRGRFFPPPPALLRGREIRPVYTSAISRAQRQSEAQAVIQTWQSAGLVAQASQSMDALDVLDPEESVRVLARAAAVPHTIVRSVREVQERQAARSQMAQEQQAMQQAGQGADILEKLAGAMGEVGAQAA